MVLECVYCWRLTTDLEARLRRFNEDRCVCGGALYPPYSPQLKAAKQLAGTLRRPRQGAK